MNKAYEFLAYLVDHWANCAWVISEYHIAIKKEESQETPLKYIFISILTGFVQKKPLTFYSFSFYSPPIILNVYDTKMLNIQVIEFDKFMHMKCSEVVNHNTFIRFLRRKLQARDHSTLILNSKTSRNEDCFHAILPSWKEYSHTIKDKNTNSNWHITDMISVKLKLYETMDNLWDKARLLYTCSWQLTSSVLPSYANQYSNELSTFLLEKQGNDKFQLYLK
ncbi:unnamed protein product [Cunninghamella echinulata]